MAHPDGIEAWVIRLDASGRNDGDSRDFELLDAAERARANRLVFGIDRARFIARRAAYRRILARYLGCDPADVAFVIAPRGKPSLVPGAHPPLEFSSSSCDGLALIVVGATTAIGADIESPRVRAELAPLARAYFSAKECAACVASDGAIATDRFLRVWTRKEAFLKLTGLGLVDDLPDVEVGTGEDGDTGHYIAPDGHRHAASLKTWALPGAPAVYSIAVPAGASLDVREFS